MRRFLIVPIAFAVLIACNSENKPAEEKKTDATAGDASATDITKDPNYAKGNQLVWGTYDCKTCHSINDKISGPAYVEVANKYAGSDTAVAYLSKKIIKGGGGVWGDPEMIPHPQVSQEDAEAMVKYILLLKK